ncbi:MAG: hypothetical protein ACW97A_05565 [Candidatus Thorarchaeota archaeon]
MCSEGKLVYLQLTTIRSEGFAYLSYFLSSEQEAIVIDPRRDVEVYMNLANDGQSQINYVFETHRNEDYIIGSLELQHLSPSAQIGHSDATNFKCGDYNISDGDTFRIGQLKVTCINTPGHTEDSMCYVVATLQRADKGFRCNLKRR